MKKIYLLFLFTLIILTKEAWAQPTFSFLPQQIQVNPGQQVCMDLDLADFTDILSVQFSIQFDPGAIDFQSITNLNPSITGLDMGDFDLSKADNGIITLNWSNGQPCNSATSGVTLPDGAKFFTICFVASGGYGNHSLVDIVDQPLVKEVKRLSANCIDIGEYIVPGFISIGTRPLTINISSADASNGETVCVDLKVKDFKNLVSFQYFIYWNPNVLQFQNASTMGLTGNYFTGQNLTASGMMSTIWYTNNINQGVTLPDGTQIMQICFKVIGSCGQSSPIYIDNNTFSTPNEPIEIIDVVTSSPSSGVNIGLLQKQGKVTVNCVNPDGIGVDIQDKNVCPGETFTVDVQVKNFEDIVKLQFSLNWNPSIIEMISPKVTFPQAGGCFNFNNPTAVNTTVSPQGLVNVNWNANSFGCDLPNNFILMRLHFKVIGPSSSNTTISIINPILVDKFGGQVVNIGINSNNGLVSVCELTSPTVVASSLQANPGETICMNFTAQDVQNIIRLQYTMNWEPNILQFVKVEGFNLPGLDDANFLKDLALSIGVLGIEWENATGAGVADGTSLYSVCFKVVGNPGTCSNIAFDGIPWAVEVKTTTSSNTNVGLNGQQGQVCVKNPLSFKVAVPNVYAGQNSEVCLDVTADNFVQLTQMNYSINWDPQVLLYKSIQTTGNLPGFGTSSYNDNISLTEDGQLSVNWSSPSQIIGTTVANGKSLFRICFTVVGNSGNCSPVTVSGFPTLQVIKTAPTGDANLGLTATPGSVCISNSINLVDALVTNLDCPSVPTGAIDLTITGGSGNYKFSWSGPGVLPAAQDQSGLTEGTYNVTVSDMLNPALELKLTYEVGLKAGAPKADAGDDTSFTCGGGFFTTLDGTGSTGTNITYFWKALSTGGLQGVVVPGDETKASPKVIGGKFYELTVTDTLTGCIDKDTVQVDSPLKPNADAGDTPGKLTCTQDTLILDGSKSSFGYDILWTTNDGQIVPGTEKFLQPKVTKPGSYILTLINPATSCSGTDTVLIEQLIEKPLADAGPDATLGCQYLAVLVGGAGSSAGTDFQYEWAAVGTGEVCGNSNTSQTTVCAPGTYQLTVTNIVNGCTKTDIVAVASNTLKPIANAGPDASLNCTIDQLTLDGSGSSSNGNFSYTWTASSGGNIVSGGNTLEPVVNAAGKYQLKVVDNSNGCEAVSEVTVNSDKTPPVISATASNDITCLVTEATLTSAGPSTGTGFAQSWINSSGNAIGTGISQVVNTPGTYTLVVTNTNNQCSATTTVVVTDKATKPVANAGTDKTITCTDNQPQLEGTIEVKPSFEIQWSGPVGNCIQNGNAATPTVSCPGDYILTVYDTLSGCITKDTVVVLLNTTPPDASAGPDTAFTCSSTNIILQGTSSQPNFIINWSSVPAGLPIQNQNSLNPTISQPGTYILTVTDNANGCSKSDLVLVTDNKQLPIANAGVDAEVDCQNKTAQLSASGSDLANTTITWKQIGGAFSSNATDIDVEQGTYELIVKNNANGCEARDTAVVVNKGPLPTVVAGDIVEKGCDQEFVTLDGTGSSPGTYTWTNEAGEVISSELSVQVSDPGTYLLTVFDPASNCENSDSVEVVSAVSPGAAQAQVDHDPCSIDAMLIGNLPTGTSGVWTSLTGANIADPAAATTQATGLKAGENIFIWTLSIGSCIDFAADTVSLEISKGAPDAANDAITLTPDQGNEVTVNVLENDEYSEINFTLVTDSLSIGAVKATDKGVITYIKEKCFANQVQILYEICDAICPELCDTAALVVKVEKNEAENCDAVPNGITPNGDGVNDQLVFDLLLNNPPDAFPDNEIIIFNRWGDVVFQAKPYLNDWSGRNKGGHELPQGTYYYILRLNIADGEIIRGDITVLK